MALQRMDGNFLGIPDVSVWLFAGLFLSSIGAHFMGMIAGAGGGLLLLVIMAPFFPPVILIPVHTLIQLGSGSSRALLMWPWVLKGTLLPFIAGSAAGAAIGAGLFVSLPKDLLMAGLALFVITVTWLPKFGAYGSERGRFTLVGFIATFLGMFVSATGMLVSPFVASASPDRRNHAATLAALMATSHITKVVAFAGIGVAIGAYVPLIAGLIVAGMIGNWLGAQALNWMRETWFRTLFKIMMTAMALRLLWSALEEAGYLN